MTVVRPIAPGEGVTLLGMIRALAEHHDLVEHLEATAEGLEAALFAPDAIVGCFLAEVEGAPAGYAFWHRSFSTFRGRAVIYLEDIAVAPGFRRRGVGEALFRAVARLAVERGCPSVYWLMMGWNDEARSFYKRLGAEGEAGMEYWRLHGESLRRFAA